MKYKAYLNFDIVDDNAEKQMKGRDLPVAMIEVFGGTVRTISFDSTSDISLVSELEQARTHQNIIVYLSNTKDHQTMNATLDLSIAKNNGRYITVLLVIERFVNNRMVEGIGLYETTATLSHAPRVTPQNNLMFNFSLRAPILSQGVIKNHRFVQGKAQDF